MNDRHAHLENCKIPKMQNASAHHTRLTTRRDVLKPKVSCTISSHIIWNFCTSPMILSLPLPCLRTLPGKKRLTVEEYWIFVLFHSFPDFPTHVHVAKQLSLSKYPGFKLICLGTSAGGPSSSLPVLYQFSALGLLSRSKFDCCSWLLPILQSWKAQCPRLHQVR